MPNIEILLHNPDCSGCVTDGCCVCKRTDRTRVSGKNGLVNQVHMVYRSITHHLKRKSHVIREQNTRNTYACACPAEA
jgi:radical SAM superfamily enzyme